MFERFTDRARRVVVLAQEEARMLNHNYIGTEHILLGLIHEGEGVAATALESLGISREAVRSQVEEIIGHGQAAPTGHIPFTPRAKKVLELSLREALQLGHNYIGTEHILLGLIREGEGVAAQVLIKLGADLEGVRGRVVALLREDIESPAGRQQYVGGFTEGARAVLGLASESARGLGHQDIEPADILLALIAGDDAQVNNLLASWGVDLDDVRRRIEELAAEEEGPAETPDPRD
jgi:ATP-dependent Clp protease ATP-binding subunit ClpC